MQFLIKGKELETLNAWETKHWEKCKDNYGGAIDGRLTYAFSPTSLGVGIKVSCSICNPTDYDSW